MTLNQTVRIKAAATTSICISESQSVERDIHLSHLSETHIHDEMIASGKSYIDMFSGVPVLFIFVFLSYSLV